MPKTFCFFSICSSQSNAKKVQALLLQRNLELVMISNLECNLHLLVLHFKESLYLAHSCSKDVAKYFPEITVIYLVLR